MSESNKKPSAGGRPVGSTKPAHLKRAQCTGIRLPQWLLDWLMEQPGSAGRIIERALIERYGLKPPGYPK